MRFILSCFLVLACVPATLRGQDSIPVTPGSRVRVESASSHRLTGKLLSIAGDTMRIARCSVCAPASIPTHDITSLEVSVGEYTPGKHVLIGALAGLVVGTVYGTIDAKRSLRGCTDGPCGLVVLEIPVTAVGGALLGALGGATWRADRWVRVPIP